MYKNKNKLEKGSPVSALPFPAFPVVPVIPVRSLPSIPSRRPRPSRRLASLVALSVVQALLPLASVARPRGIRIAPAAFPTAPALHNVISSNVNRTVEKVVSHSNLGTFSFLEIYVGNTIELTLPSARSSVLKYIVTNTKLKVTSFEWDTTLYRPSDLRLTFGLRREYPVLVGDHQPQERRPYRSAHPQSQTSHDLKRKLASKSIGSTSTR